MAGKRSTTNSGNANDTDNGPVEPIGESSDNGPANTIVDPATIGTDAGSVGEYGDEYERDAAGNLVYSERTGKPRRKRGRRSGGSNSGTATKSGKGNSQTVTRGIETLSQTLLIVHMGLASFTKFDQFALEKPEADALSHSLANVMEQFDWAPDPRFTAIAGLVTTSATIYGPRLYLYREHLKENAKNKSPSKPDNVQQFNSGNFGNLAG